MDINCYLAMTAAEFTAAGQLPRHIAYMACHYSSSGNGLSNLPTTLPPGAMVILNDLVPPQEHDPALIADQLAALAQSQQAGCVLLDLQRPDMRENQQIAAAIVQALPCPVAVTPQYAGQLDCPVFLPPPPLHTPLEKHLQQWQGRKIWLEAALETGQITLTAQGSQYTPQPDRELPSPSFTEERLHCRYHIDIREDRVNFTLQRGARELSALLREANALGVTQAVGLYQQLKDFL